MDGRRQGAGGVRRRRLRPLLLASTTRSQRGKTTAFDTPRCWLGTGAAAAEVPAADQHNKTSSHRRWSHTKELATSAGMDGRPSATEQRWALGIVGGLLDPHLALLQRDTQSRGLPPVRCASTGAERRGGGLCVGPAVREIPPPAKKDKKNKQRTLL
jgi:hypothetical protein